MLNLCPVYVLGDLLCPDIQQVEPFPKSVPKPLSMDLWMLLKVLMTLQAKAGRIIEIPPDALAAAPFVVGALQLLKALPVQATLTPSVCSTADDLTEESIQRIGFGCPDGGAFQAFSIQ